MGVAVRSATYERKLCHKLRDDGIDAERGPGSLRRDIFAWWPTHTEDDVRYYRIRLGEVKKTRHEDTFYFQGSRVRSQFHEYKALTKGGYEVFWAVRFVTGPRDNRWRFWDMTTLDEPDPLRRNEGMTYDEYWGVNIDG